MAFFPADFLVKSSSANSEFVLDHFTTDGEWDILSTNATARTKSFGYESFSRVGFLILVAFLDIHMAPLQNICRLIIF